MAGPKLTFDDGKRTLEITQAYQVWNIASFDPNGIPKPEARDDIYLRRARLGLRGQAYTNLDYVVSFAYDNVGKDPYIGTIGSPQVVPNTTFQVWDAYFNWHADSTWANLTFGLFRPITGREFSSSYSAVPSLENALTYYYLRDHLLTRPSGQETGINLGGFFADSAKMLAFGYNFGAFDAAQERVTTAPAGSLNWSPLLTGRISATVGDAENKNYRSNSDFNFFGKRTGITIGGFGAWQGKQDVDTIGVTSSTYDGGFKQNTAFGGDVLANWKYLELDGEVDVYRRTFSVADTAAIHKVTKATNYVSATDYQDWAWHIRGGYSIPVMKTQFVEPSVLFTQFFGDKKSPVNTNGKDQILDGGVNWYLQKNNLKLSLHYVRQEGRPKSMYTQGLSKGVFKERNDFVALALQLNY